MNGQVNLSKVTFQNNCSLINTFQEVVSGVACKGGEESLTEM